MLTERLRTPPIDEQSETICIQGRRRRPRPSIGNRPDRTAGLLPRKRDAKTNAVLRSARRLFRPSNIENLKCQVAEVNGAAVRAEEPGVVRHWSLMTEVDPVVITGRLQGAYVR